MLYEHVAFHQKESDVPVGGRAFCIPFGSARVVRPGSACTVLATSVVVQQAVEAAEESGTDAEIIDLRNLDDHGIDWQTISRSIEKTGRVIIAEQTARRLSMGAPRARKFRNASSTISTTRSSG